MARRLFYPKEEILSKDFNILRNDYEKLFLDRFLGNSVPRIPAFIGGGFKPELNGNQVNVEPGIGLQRINQTDGSSSIRLMALESEQTLSFVLPAVGVTKTDIIQARSVIVNEPNENRNFKVGASVQDRSTLISQKWSAEVQVKQNAVADAQGVYTADVGWVIVAVVTLNSTGITALEDARDFYNLFDPDFFSVYGRKNVSFHKAYDGVNLIEVPFEFSDLVPKIDQVSVRRVSRERYGEITVTNKYNTDFSFTAPVASVTTITKGNFLTLTSIDVEDALERHSRSNPSRRGYYTLGEWSTTPVWRHSDHIGIFAFSTGVKKDQLFTFYIDQMNNIRISSISFLYVLLWKDGEPTKSNTICYKIPAHRLDDSSPVNSGGRYPPSWTFNANYNNDPRKGYGILRGTFYDSVSPPVISPIYKAISVWEANRLRIQTTNPISQTVGSINYVFSTGTNISNFYRLESMSYNPSTQELKWTLSSPIATNPIFPSEGNVFNKAIIKKGTERRLNINNNDLTISTRVDSRKSYADYTYNLTSQDTLIKDSDSSFTDFNIEFEVVNSTGEEIWRANSMRGGEVLSNQVDFKLEEEGLRTYVRLNDQYPFREDDELIFSHIVPQELIDAGAGGTPEDQDLATQLAALRTTVASNTRNITTNTNDISVLENASQAGDITFYYGIFSIPGGRTKANRTNAQTVSYVQPLAQAELNSPTERTAKTISSITLGGGLVTFNAGATVGYYSPWVAIESTDIGTGTLYVTGSGGDESSFWRPAGTVTLNTKEYSIYVRTTPIINGKNLKVIFQVFE